MTAVRRLLAALVAVGLVGALAGCNALGSTGDKQYVEGTGRIVQIAPADRGKPVSASGKDLDGQALSLAAYRGRVVMLNVWAGWCPPCREETPTVVALAGSLARQGVTTLGVNIRENGGTAAARTFAQDHGMTYPSFYDPSSSVLLDLSAKLGPYSLPSTVVLDQQGRVAALVIGQIPGEATMREVVEQVVRGG